MHDHQDEYEAGWRDAAAFIAKVGIKRGRAYRKEATAHEGKGEDWKVLAAEAAGTALIEFCRSFPKPPKEPKP